MIFSPVAVRLWDADLNADDPIGEPVKLPLENLEVGRAVSKTLTFGVSGEVLLETWNKDDARKKKMDALFFYLVMPFTLVAMVTHEGTHQHALVPL